MATSAKKKTNQNTSYTTTSGQKVSIKNGVKTYSGAATPAPKIGSVVNGTKVGYNVGGKSYANSSDAERGNAIDVATIPAKMTPETPANIPTYTIPNFGDITGQNNIGLGAVTSQFGTTYDAKTGQFVTAPTGTQDNFQSLFEQATALGNTAFEEMGTAESRLKKLEKENQLKQKQQAVNETTGQINAIVAQAQAQQLALEGQGRGQTSGFIGGEQARINREAAIQAIPLQAKLAAEQGALELAQEHIDKMFTVQSQDALAKYQYKSKLIESVYNFATGAEQRRLDAIKAKEDRAYDMQKFNIQYQRDLAKDAASYGLGGVAASILKLNPTSPTFSQDIASLQGKVVKPVEAKAPTTQEVNGKLYQYNYGTGKWDLAAGFPDTTTDGMNPDVISYAQQFADTGKLPGVGELKNSGITVTQVTDYAKQLPKPNGALLSQSTGVKSSTLSPTQEDGILALKDISQKIKELKILDEERQKGLLSATVGKIFGSDDQQRYIDLRGEIVDLLARARTGAALTAQEEKFYADQLPGRIAQVGVIPGTGMGLFGVNSQERIDNFDSKITSTLETKLSGQGLVIQGYSKVDVPSLGKKTVGEILDIGGTQYRVLPDGTLTDNI